MLVAPNLKDVSEQCDCLSPGIMQCGSPDALYLPEARAIICSPRRRQNPRLGNDRAQAVSLFSSDTAFCHLSTTANFGANHLKYLEEEKERQALAIGQCLEHAAHLPFFSLTSLSKDRASI